MDLIQILDEHGVDYREHGSHEHASEGWIQTQCPMCSPGGNYRLGFSLSSLACSCWGCGRLNAGEMLGLLIGKPKKVGWAILGKVERVGFAKKHRGKLKLPSGLAPLSKLPAHRRYLEGRGFDCEELEEVWGVQGTTGISSHPWSLVIPVTQNYETVSFTTRKLHDKGRRYTNARDDEEAVSAKEVLFGGDYACNTCVVVEGFLDAIKIGPGAVATGGLAISQSQVRAIGKFHKRVICLDSSPDAQRTAMQLCRRLSLYEGQTLNVCLDSKDPGEASEEELTQLRGMLQ